MTQNYNELFLFVINKKRIFYNFVPTNKFNSNNLFLISFGVL